MKERPILMSAPMVRALLAGTKTQTRRIMKLPPLHSVANEPWALFWRESPARFISRNRVGGDTMAVDVVCPYGIAGDRLWVKEAWRTSRAFDGLTPKEMEADARFNGYEPDGAPRIYLVDDHSAVDGRYRHARFMPRYFSRTTLEVTEVRVQRLHEITEKDAVAEGVMGLPARGGTVRARYAALWDEINGEGAWALNPFVWAISFAVVPT